MRKPWVLAAVLAVMLVVGIMVFHFIKASFPSGPDAMVFHLRYRGLAGPDDKLSYGRAWSSSGTPETDTPFIRAVKQRVQEFVLVHYSQFRNGDWSVVEIKDRNPVALYFDLDANGDLSENERILPTPLPERFGDVKAMFVTPDFMLRRQDGREVPFRAMLLHVSPEGNAGYYAWSPACILEGQATCAGESMRLFLYGDRFSGSFTTFGRCFFSLVPAGRELEGEMSRTMLSSLVYHQGTFYRLKFEGVYEKDATLRVTLTRDTSPLGRVPTDLPKGETLQVHLDTVAAITGENDSSIQLKPESSLSLLPVGKYRFSTGSILYGLDSDDQWRVDFSEGPAFTITRDRTTVASLRAPTISIKAIDESERLRSDARHKSVFTRGASIYLIPQIIGPAAEIYTRFCRRDPNDADWNTLAPHVTILDPDGKEVASADTEFS